MIRVDAILDEEGILRNLEIRGHSSYKKRNDIVCASVSILSQTFLLSLESVPEIDFDFDDDGDLFKIVVNDWNKIFLSELRGISLFLTIGLEAVKKEYKNIVILNVNKGA
ncbi:MAG TPA: ribosomal-processing cysteine protease Prp [Spirochaetota bacterium]|nr:ribosomal-processing cysteine protease Prp [Spirochaetota bacterium]